MLIKTQADIAVVESGPRPNEDIQSTYALIQRAAERTPQAQALSFFLRTEDYRTLVSWNYRDWLADITRLANLLRRKGVGRKHVVAFVTNNYPETHLTIWAAETAGIAFAVNPLLDGKQIGELFRAAKVRWVVAADPGAEPEIWQRLESALAGKHGVCGVLAFDGQRHQPGRTTALVLPPRLAGVPVYDMGREAARERSDALDFALPKAEDIASYFCTGGTTGLPKIAQHTHRNEIAQADQLGTAVGDAIFAPGRTTLTALPLFHVNAAVGTGLSAFARGSHVLLAPPAGYRAPGLVARFWEVIEAHRVSSFSGVPTVYAGLLQSPRQGRDLSCLTAAICGAAPMPVDLFHKFEAETGLRILEGYGLTEGSCASSITPPAAASCIGSIGLRLPWQPMRVMCLDDEGRFLRGAQTDEVGSIYISGPNVFPGYLNPEHNRGVWFETDVPDGVRRRWFNTGDLGRQDAKGYFWLTGRKKELIIRGGHNIDPKSIEEVLSAHPAVALCAAVGRPDAHAGEVPVAYVQLRPGASASGDELMQFATERINERAAIPKAVIPIPALPVTAVGKVFKPALSMREIESVVREEAVNADVELAALTLEQDPKLGMLARYRLLAPLTEAASRFRAALGQYVFRSQEML